MITRRTYIQWTFDVDEATGTYNIYNRGPNGEKQFYEVVPGKYGEPIIVAEPELAFDPPANLRYDNVKGAVVVPDQKIAGIVCQNGPRGSLTNLQKQVKKPVTVNEDGSLQIGEEKWWIVKLLLKDKNRIRNYDAFCVRQKPLGEVRIIELGDLNLF